MTSAVKSGGAAGADYLWLRKSKHVIQEHILYTFEGHRCLKPHDRCEIRTLTEDQLAMADEALTYSSRCIVQKKLPALGTYSRKLLQRNWWIVREVDAVFAVGYITPDGKIEGGTGWACSVREPGTPLFIFDMKKKRWYAEVETFRFIACEVAPKIANYDVVALIGSRNMTEEAPVAMDDVLRA